MSIEKNYKNWLENAPKNVVDKIINYSEEEKSFSFLNDLSFGTAGLRGVMGYGSSLINEFNIAKYSYAMGKFILSKYGDDAKKNGIIIAHDNRRNNLLFSESAAKVISSLGIKVYFFKNNLLQPTPLLSYAISNGNYVGGINITASHNPPEYSGFKVYNHNGIQMLPYETDLIIEESKKIKNIFKIKKDEKNIFFLSDEIEKNYIQEILRFIPFDFSGKEKKIKVVFTPQHGTAGKIATKIMKKLKVDFTLVKEQMNPDPEFTNTISPNPQNSDSFILARKYGNKVNANVLFCTDPDADRFGIEVKHNNKWIHIDGNQLPLIQLSYKLMNLKKQKNINNGDFIVKSVVTSKAAELIAKKYSVKVYDSLTGFKWLISESFIHESKGNECLFAWEESYGSTLKTFTKDKDSFQALVQVIELSDFYFKKNKTLVDVLEEIYKEIGYWYSPQYQIKFNGLNAMSDMLKIIETAKKFKVGQIINKFKITKIIDFSKGYKNFFKDNFVQLVIDNKHRVTFRPSGTEPVLRIYFDVVSNSMKLSKEIQMSLQEIFSNLEKYN